MAQGFAGRRGRRPLRLARGMGDSGSLPLIRPCGATFPQGGRQGLLLAAAGGRGRVGAPRPTDGDMETLRGLRGHPFPGRRTVGAGHARPGGWREHPSMVRSVGRGLDPSAGVGGSGSLRGWLPVDGCWRKVSRGVGDAAPYGLPGEWATAGGRGGVGAPRPTDGDMETPAGFTWAPVPGPPHGRGRACPARGLA